MENAKKIALIIKKNEKIVKRVLKVHRKEMGNKTKNKVLDETAKNVIKTLIEKELNIKSTRVMNKLKESKLPFSRSTVKKACTEFR